MREERERRRGERERERERHDHTISVSATRIFHLLLAASIHEYTLVLINR